MAQGFYNDRPVRVYHIPVEAKSTLNKTGLMGSTIGVLVTLGIVVWLVISHLLGITSQNNHATATQTVTNVMMDVPLWSIIAFVFPVIGLVGSVIGRMNSLAGGILLGVGCLGIFMTLWFPDQTAVKYIFLVFYAVAVILMAVGGYQLLRKHLFPA